MRAGPAPGHVAESPHPQRAAVCAGVREGMAYTSGAQRIVITVIDACWRCAQPYVHKDGSLCIMVVELCNRHSALGPLIARVPDLALNKRSGDLSRVALSQNARAFDGLAGLSGWPRHT